jgi:phytoene dehydrogenase-like protein
VPELGASIEALETASPRTFYDQTRRKLGMVMGFERTVGQLNVSATTTIPNLFIVGDTASPTPGLSPVVEAAMRLANDLTK